MGTPLQRFSRRINRGDGTRAVLILYPFAVNNTPSYAVTLRTRKTLKSNFQNHEYERQQKCPHPRLPLAPTILIFVSAPTTKFLSSRRTVAGTNCGPATLAHSAFRSVASSKILIWKPPTRISRFSRTCSTRANFTSTVLSLLGVSKRGTRLHLEHWPCCDRIWDISCFFCWAEVIPSPGLL
jgi:hypothetical protein